MGDETGAFNGEILTEHRYFGKKKICGYIIPRELETNKKFAIKSKRHR